MGASATRSPEAEVTAASFRHAQPDLRGYLEAIGEVDLVPKDLHARRVQLDAHLIEKALYEIRYELDHRPDWVGIPIAGLKRLLQADPREGSA